MVALNDASTFRAAFDSFTPRTRTRFQSWASDRMVNEYGRPFDHTAYPHHGAPGGPMDAFDDAGVREIVLQFGTRLGKTFFGQCCALKLADEDPCPMIFATATEELCKRVIGRTYAICNHRDHLKKLLRYQYEKAQKATLIRFKDCVMPGAWARSPATLGDITAVFGHANEVPKWEHASTSKEAHPLELFGDRFKDVQHISKGLYEGTPTIKGRCPIEDMRLGGWDCSFMVPCPHCKRYQKLVNGDGHGHGLRYEKTENGRSNKELARTSAHYQCEHCGLRVETHHRNWMMRRGVWCPVGCEVVDSVALEITQAWLGRGEMWKWRGWKSAEWVSGEPVNNGVRASYHLSSLYALSLDWGDVAAKFVGSKGTSSKLRNFVNQWLAETWETAKRSGTWESIFAKIGTNMARGVVPAWADVVAVGVDRQEDFFVFTVVAANKERRLHVMDYGLIDTERDLAGLLGMDYDVEGSSEKMSARFMLVDSGHKTSEIYNLCKRHKRMIATKGASISLAGFYQVKKLGDKSSHPGLKVVFLDGDSTQDWVDRAIYVVENGQPNSLSMFAAEQDEAEAFISQLMNEQIEYVNNVTNHSKGRWVRINEHLPNDARDCLRSGLVGCLMALKSQPMRKFSVKPKASHGGDVPVVKLSPVKG